MAAFRSIITRSMETLGVGRSLGVQNCFCAACCSAIHDARFSLGRGAGCFKAASKNLLAIGDDADLGPRVLADVFLGGVDVHETACRATEIGKRRSSVGSIGCRARSKDRSRRRRGFARACSTSTCYRRSSDDCWEMRLAACRRSAPGPETFRQSRSLPSMRASIVCPNRSTAPVCALH